jgi:putative transposase
VVGSSRQRKAVSCIIKRGISERKACKILGYSRSTIRYKSKRIVDEGLRKRIKNIAYSPKYRRAGYRRIYKKIRRTRLINHKKVYRIYTELGLKIRVKKRKKRVPMPITPIPVPQTTNAVWAMDFMSDCFSDKRRFRTLNILDICSREAVGIEVDTSIPSLRVIRTLEKLKVIRGLPRDIVLDNGPEFIAGSLERWTKDNGIDLHFIDKGKPTQNAFIESFNGKFRNECLNEHIFVSLKEAKKIIEDWRNFYNKERYLAPEEFVNKKLTKFSMHA